MPFSAPRGLHGSDRRIERLAPERRRQIDARSLVAGFSLAIANLIAASRRAPSMPVPGAAASASRIARGSRDWTTWRAPDVSVPPGSPLESIRRQSETELSSALRLVMTVDYMEEAKIETR